MGPEGMYRVGSRIYMVDGAEETVVSVNVLENRSDDYGFDYDLRVISVDRDVFDVDVEMGEQTSISGYYNMEGPAIWKLVDRLQTPLA